MNKLMRFFSNWLPGLRDNPPACRLAIVESDDRYCTIKQESRFANIEPESRIVTVRC